MGFETRADRGKNRGRAGLPGQRAEYFRLTDLGYSNAAAWRAVGVTVRTGRRWRHGRPPEAPTGLSASLLFARGRASRFLP
jgi:transposase, IS30 family